MRLVPVLLAMGLLLLSSANALTWDDPAADHTMTYRTGIEEAEDLDPTVDGDTLDMFRYVDLLGAGVEESEEALRFWVEVAADAPGDNDPEDFEYGQYRFWFTFHGEQRAAEFHHELDGSGDYFILGRPSSFFGGNWIRADAFAFSEPLEEGIGWQATVAKEDLRDLQEIPARAGDVLGDLRVNSSAGKYSYSYPCAPSAIQRPHDCWDARDSIDGAPLGELELTMDPPGVGHLLWLPEAPFRASNGQATTYLFELPLHNLGDAPDTVLLQVGDRPEDWTVHMPTVVDLPPQGNATVPVAVSVPFSHAHGQLRTLSIRAASQEVSDIEAVTEIGVVWTEVPQPGGHHSRLQIHGNDHWGWMNTLETDPNADGDRFSASSYSSSGGIDGTHREIAYRAALDPALQMGLDFDVDGTVAYGFDIQSEDPLPESSLTVRLRISGEPEIVVGEETTQIDLESGDNRIEGTLAVAPEADHVPYGQDRQLHLDIELETFQEGDLAGALIGGRSGFSGVPVILTRDAFLQLPLFDFHAIIDDALLQSLSKLSISADNVTQKMVNPGKTAVFSFTAANHAGGEAAVAWDVLGENKDWATVTPEKSVLRGGGNGTVALRVAVPDDAVEGDEADLLLVGQSTSDPNVQVFAHVVALVTTSKDIPDEAADAEALEDQARKTADKGLPAPGIVLVALAVGAVAWLRRR